MNAPAPESKKALLEALQQSIKTEQERKAAPPPPPPPRTRPAVVLVLGILILAGVGVLWAQPAWLVTPATHTESDATRDASLRVLLYAQAEKVRRFRADARRLPETLDELPGFVPRQVEYRRLDEQRFVVSAALDAQRLELTSEDDPSAFLGDALRILAQRQRR